MGSETFLYLNASGKSLVARVDPAGAYSVGQSLEVALDLSRAHLFDASSEQAL